MQILHNGPQGFVSFFTLFCITLLSNLYSSTTCPDRNLLSILSSLSMSFSQAEHSFHYSSLANSIQCFPVLFECRISNIIFQFLHKTALYPQSKCVTPNSSLLFHCVIFLRVLTSVWGYKLGLCWFNIYFFNKDIWTVRTRVITPLFITIYLKSITVLGTQ